MTNTIVKPMTCEVGAMCDEPMIGPITEWDTWDGYGHGRYERPKSNAIATTWVVRDCCYRNGAAACQDCHDVIINRFTCPMCGD